MSQKEKFIEWLEEQVETVAPLNSYPNALKRLIPDKLIQIGEQKYTDLFNCDDIAYLQELYRRLSNGGDLHQFNVNTQSRLPSAAVNKYIVFLEYQKSNIDIKNIILYGAPGVGKTYSYKKIIALIEGQDFKKQEIFDFIINNKDDEIEKGSVEKLFNNIILEKRLQFLTFHQSYSYEDFIEGFRPNKKGNIELEDGIFKKLCDDADKNKEKNFYIVIDEINRGNISKIFGELITLIEEDKRDIYEVTLPYSKEPFKVPSNLYIIATMNSTDKSIATIDIALRRRFTFLKMKPNLTLVKNDNARDMMKKLNEYIVKNLNVDYQLGHSYFMKVQNDEDLEFVIEYKIKPLLEEYFYAEEKSADEIIDEATKNSNQGIK